MSLLFIGFVFIISSLVIHYSDDYTFGDLNIVRFILLDLTQFFQGHVSYKTDCRAP
jgi:hypothetical protein